MPDALSRIGAATARRVARLKKELPLKALRGLPLYGRAPRDFKKALSGAGPGIIAEIKFSSPSEGVLREGASAQAAVKIAEGYLASGAKALSILTEPEFFAGSHEYLAAVREKFPEAPLLMKDFFIDPYQFELARAVGADAVLLIAAMLGDKLKALLEGAQKLGLSVLVETHTEEELAAARDAGAKLIGVNSRNLKTLKTDLEVAKKLGQLAAKSGALAVAESGIASRADIEALSECGYGAFLVGTRLMRQADPGAALKALLSA